jgi:ribosomal protein S18 acetylase RimI-like enzyme
MQLHDLAEIRPMTVGQLPEYADVIRRSFETVARDFGLTEENCPAYKSFTTDERLGSKLKEGYYPFGICIGEKITGFASLTDRGGGTYEMNSVCVLPEYRHYGYGKKLLDFCKTEVGKLGESIITIGIIEENTVLKDWYAANGFVHTGTKKIDRLPFTVGFMEWRAKTEG